MSTRYKILCPLEPGPDVRVYDVRDSWNGDQNRVLTLLDYRRGDQSSSGMQFESAYFRRESLAHEYLIRVLDIAYRGRRAGVVSEKVLGEFQLPTTMSSRLMLAVGIAELVRYLHQRQFFFGVLKPSQLLCRHDGKLAVNLLLSGPFAVNLAKTSALRYSAPEFLESRAPSQASDFYSVGMLLYLLFTGCEPFIDKNPRNVRGKQYCARLIRPRKINPDIPAEVEDLIVDLTEKVARGRPQDPGYIVSTLKGQVAHPRVSASSLRSSVVGRDAETDEIREFLGGLKLQSRTRFFVIHGGSGIGKTRLIEQGGILARLYGFAVCYVRHHVGAEPLMALSTLADRLRCGVRRPDNNPTKDDLLSELRCAMSELARIHGGVVVCADDLQWMDEGESDIYHRLGCDGDLPVLFLGAFRTDTNAGCWPDLERQLELQGLLSKRILRPLTRDAAKRVLSNILGSQVSESVSKRICDYSSGNPFFIHELVRSYVSQNQLIYRDKRWLWKNLTFPVFSQLPVGIEQHIQCRLASLNDLEKRVLEYVSVFERPVRIQWLEMILGESYSKILDTSVSLSRLELIELDGSLGNCGVTLAHDWIAKVVRSGLCEQSRKEIHRGIAECLKLEVKGRPSSLLNESLVRHCWNSGDLVGVLDNLWDAVTALKANGMYRRVASILTRGHSEGLLRPSDWRAVEETVKSLYLCGRLVDCVDFARSYLSHFKSQSTERIAWIQYVIASVYAIQGLFDSAVKHGERALDHLRGNRQSDLELQIKCVLLCSLSQNGRFLRAKRLSREIEFDVQLSSSLADKLYHALAVYLVHVEGSYWSALGAEVASIRMSIENSNDVQFLGRLTHLMSIYCKLARIDYCDRIARFCLSHSPESLNLQVGRFARLNWCDGKRKQGFHRAASILAQEARDLGREDNNSYIRWVSLIEEAKNLNYRLLPESALRRLDYAAQVCGSETQALIDLELTGSWSLLLLGQFDRNGAKPSQNSSWNATNRARLRLLHANAALSHGEVAEAWSCCAEAEALFPEQLPYYRVRIGLLRAEILLAQGEVAEARKHATDALSIARDRFLFPMMAKGYALLGKCLAEEGQLRRGRAYCLRALQVARRVERPALRAEIHRILGNVEARLGDLSSARQSYARAIRILKERSLYLSREYRESFTRHRIEPIMVERAQVTGSDPYPGPRFLQEITHLLAAIKAAPDLRTLAEAVLEATRTCIPESSARFLLQKPDGRTEILASIGQCRHTGRSPDDKTGFADIADRFEVDRSESSYQTLRVPLPLEDPGLSAALYLESNHGELTEDELDFLTCLSPAVELSPLNGWEEPIQSPQDRTGLPLPDGRKLVGDSPRMKALFQEVQLIAPSRATVLLYGESGTGKELLAAAVHAYSRRSSGPFLAVSCSALPGDLIENELFGHVKGAYTGADRSQAGLFEAACGGTLFLDEISAMPLDLQARLLRVLEERRVRRVGDVRERPVDVRIVAATNLPLRDLVAEKRFRSDLFHRLNVCQLHIPPLRERLSDLGLLIHFFLNQLAQQEGSVKRLDAEALARLSLYNFPGNVRELRNIIESAYYLCCGPVISTRHFENRLEEGAAETSGSGPSLARQLLRRLASGNACFWKDVKRRYLARDISRREVRELIALGLATVNGSYRKLLEYFGMPASDYRRFMSFLTHHDCKVDFRPFRKGSPQVVES